MTSPSTADPDAVVVEGVTVRYRDHEALKDLSFHIPPGRFVAVVGPNGSGKTTLLKTLLGLEMPDQGTVQVLGQSPTPLRQEPSGMCRRSRRLIAPFRP